MNTSDQLGRFDRSTLVLWRVSNLIVWVAAAVVVGGFVAYTAANLARAVDLWWTAHGFDNELTIVRALEVVASGASGALIGAIVGRHVYRAPEVVALISAALPGWFATRVYDFGLVPKSARLVVLVVLVDVVAAVLVARRSWRRRPLALRGGRGPQ